MENKKGKIEMENNHKQELNCKCECKAKVDHKSSPYNPSIIAKICPNFDLCGSFVKFEFAGSQLSFESTSVSEPSCHEISVGTVLDVGGTGILETSTSEFKVAFTLNLLERDIGITDAFAISFIFFDQGGNFNLIAFALPIPDEDLKIVSCINDCQCHSSQPLAINIQQNLRTLKENIMITYINGKLTQRTF